VPPLPQYWVMATSATAFLPQTPAELT
jgi:hypothetical protein